MINICTISYEGFSEFPNTKLAIFQQSIGKQRESNLKTDDQFTDLCC
jgi:hypothetical protein